MNRRSRSKVLTGTQELLGIEYQSPPLSDRSLTDRSGAPCLTGTETSPVLSFLTGTLPPLNGGSTSQKAERGSDTLGGSEGGSGVLGDADIKELPAALLPSLPLSVTLYGASSGAGLGCYLCGERAVWEALVARGAVVFGLLEWQALVSAFMVGRAQPASFAKWCECKAGLPTYRVQLADALGCVLGPEPPEYQVPSVGRVLDGWGFRLRAVHYGKDLLTL